MSKEPPEGQRTGAAGEEPRLRRAMNQQHFEIKRVTTDILAVEHPFSVQGSFFCPVRRAAELPALNTAGEHKSI